MDELDAIRRRKLDDLRRRQEQNPQYGRDGHQDLSQQIQKLEIIVKRMLTKEALSRYGNVKAAHPEVAVRLLAHIGQRIQKGASGLICDADLKDMLKRLAQDNHSIKINRK